MHVSDRELAMGVAAAMWLSGWLIGRLWPYKRVADRIRGDRGDWDDGETLPGTAIIVEEATFDDDYRLPADPAGLMRRELAPGHLAAEADLPGPGSSTAIDVPRPGLGAPGELVTGSFSFPRVNTGAGYTTAVERHHDWRDLFDWASMTPLERDRLAGWEYSRRHERRLAGWMEQTRVLMDQAAARGAQLALAGAS